MDLGSEAEDELFLLAASQWVWFYFTKANERTEDIGIEEPAILFNLLSVDLCERPLRWLVKSVLFIRKYRTSSKLSDVPAAENSEDIIICHKVWGYNYMPETLEDKIIRHKLWGYNYMSHAANLIAQTMAGCKASCGFYHGCILLRCSSCSWCDAAVWL